MFTKRLLKLADLTPVQAMRITLAARFPLCFMPKGAEKRPLAIGIAAQIYPAAPDLDRRLIGHAISDYVSGRKYQANVVAGAARLNLDGTTASIVSPEQATWAASHLRTLERKWEKKRQKQKRSAGAILQEARAQ